jgi:response regulator RpfG family c-di-GMP phosphodiesterase
MPERILLVDDERNITEAIRRSLHGQFCLETFSDPEEALTAIRERGPYAVVVSDLQMPVIDGIRLLAQVKEHSPDTVRMMLTGKADLEAAIAAVNEGAIFRFLTKPCPFETLAKALRAALDQYRLVMAEHELLEQTLTGSIEVLTDILAIIHPTAFSRSYRLRRYVRHMVDQLGVASGWQFETAAMLSQIGCVTLPLGTLDKLFSGEALSEDEARLFSLHPEVARTLLIKIPRLDAVAEMIRLQQAPYGNAPPDSERQATIELGAQMLRLASDFDQLIARGLSREEALGDIRRRIESYNPRLVVALEAMKTPQDLMESRSCALGELRPPMVVEEDIRARNGFLLIARGEQITYPGLERLRTVAAEVGVVEPIRVLVPKQPGSERAARPIRTCTPVGRV